VEGGLLVEVDCCNINYKKKDALILMVCFEEDLFSF
jgi:hypothetical protein